MTRRAKAAVAQMAKRLTETYRILAHAPRAGVLMPRLSIRFLVLLLLLGPPNPRPQPTPVWMLARSLRPPSL